MAIWLHGTLYVTIHEAKNVPLDRRIRLPDKVLPVQRPPFHFQLTCTQPCVTENAEPKLCAPEIVRPVDCAVMHSTETSRFVAGKHPLMFAQAKHRLKPVDKLIGKVEKLTVGEHPSNAYVVVSIGEGSHNPRVWQLPCKISCEPGAQDLQTFPYYLIEEEKSMPQIAIIARKACACAQVTVEGPGRVSRLMPTRSGARHSPY